MKLALANQSDMLVMRGRDFTMKLGDQESWSFCTPHRVYITPPDICKLILKTVSYFLLVQFNLHLTGDIHAITAANNLLGK